MKQKFKVGDIVKCEKDSNRFYTITKEPTRSFYDLPLKYVLENEEEIEFILVCKKENRED